MLHGYPHKQKTTERNIKNLLGDFKDGTAICALLESIKPGSLPKARAPLFVLCYVVMCV
jgi:hypothetical protein